MAAHVVLYLKTRCSQYRKTACKFEAELGDVGRALIVAEEVAAQDVTHFLRLKRFSAHVTNAS
jgi:hypothetical protein